MAKTKKQMGLKKKKPSLFFILTVVLVLAITIVLLLPKGNSNNTDEANSGQNSVGSGIAATLNDNGDVVINGSEITEKVTFLEYKAQGGTTVGLLAVKASDGTIRTALDTCQVCNGSPSAYFTQNMRGVQCQNCGNIFSIDMIEQERGGCNPIPIMPEDKTITDTEIIIPAAILEENVDLFENWKKF